MSRELEVKYKVHIEHPDDRKKKIRQHIAHHLKHSKKHEQRYWVKSALKMCAVIKLPIDLPAYHLNNGRTRAAQSSYMFNEEKKDNFFADGQNNNLQQKIQHEILFKAANENPSIYKELKRRKIFSQDEALLVDVYGMVINGNRRLCSVRELYKEDPKMYKNFADIPCAIIEDNLLPHDIKDIEAYYQIKKSFRQDYDFISLAMDIRYEHDELKMSYPEIASKMDKHPNDVQQSYEMLEQIDICLEKDWKKPRGYPLIQNQEQIWTDSAKRAFKNKDPIAKLAIYKIARWLSVNASKLEDRVYNFARILQNRNNLKGTIDFLAGRFHVYPTKEKRSKVSNDPLDELTSAPTQFNLSIIEKIPVKKNDPETLQDAMDDAEFTKDDKAALKLSNEILKKTTLLDSTPLSDNKKEIKRNLQKVVDKMERIISKKLK